MAIALNDKIRMVLSGKVLGEQWQNVLHWSVNSPAASTYAEFAEAWWLDFGDLWQNTCSPTTGILSVEVYDNEDPLGEYGFYAPPVIDNTGIRTGEQSAPFLATGVKWNVATRATKPGSIRLPGLTETDMLSGGQISTAYATAVQAYADAMVAGLSFGLLGAGGAVLVVYGAPHAASTRFPARATGVYNTVISATVNELVTSQVSRKYGRGS